MPVSVPLLKFCEKLLHHTKFYWILAISSWVMAMAKKRFFKMAAIKPSWIFKILIFGHMTVTKFHMCICTKFHQNQRIFRWDIMILLFTMAPIRHLELSTFRVFVTWPLWPCYSASLCKISTKSDYRLLNNNQKWTIFKMVAVRLLEFKKKLSYLVMWLSPS